jgi:hypothetical protein
MNNLDGSNWQPSEVLPLSSGIVTVAAGAGITAGVAIQRALTQALPSGARLLVRSLSVSVLNGPASQILVSLGAGSSHPHWTNRNGQSFQTLGEIPVNVILDPPGPFFIDLANITGTSYTGAQGAAVALDVVVAVDAVILNENNRGIVQHR